MARIALATLGLIAVAAPEVQASSPRVVLDVRDPPKDDHGPGDYVYPSRPAYRPRTFDLRRFRALDDGDTLRLEATFARPIERPREQPRRTRAIEIPLENAIYVKHVDIYIRTGREPGMSEGIPGRRIRFGPTDEWHRAVVLTPQPHLLRSLLDDWKGAPRTLIPANLRSVGPTITVRIPKAELGDGDPRSWGWAVTVSGALWENRFQFYGPKPHDFTTNALTMPVVPVADRRRFGGGPMTPFHPHVIDLLAPGEGVQSAVLSGSDPETESFAPIPMLFPAEP